MLGSGSITVSGFVYVTGILGTGMEIWHRGDGRRRVRYVNGFDQQYRHQYPVIAVKHAVTDRREAVVDGIEQSRDLAVVDVPNHQVSGLLRQVGVRHVHPERLDFVSGFHSSPSVVSDTLTVAGTSSAPIPPSGAGGTFDQFSRRLCANCTENGCELPGGVS